jgi:hypothetical protein
MMLQHRLLLVFLAALLAGTGHADDASTELEITQLLTRVEQSGCTFNRNGTAHDPAAAADHLRLKYSRGKKYVGSAEQFIDRLATKSSWTGKPYTVDCPDQPSQPAGQWLHGLLDDYRAGR